MGQTVDLEAKLNQLEQEIAILKRRIENNNDPSAGTYVLTGEDASYNGVKARHPFDFNGNWVPLHWRDLIGISIVMRSSCSISNKRNSCAVILRQ